MINTFQVQLFSCTYASRMDFIRFVILGTIGYMTNWTQDTGKYSNRLDWILFSNYPSRQSTQFSRGFLRSRRISGHQSYRDISVITWKNKCWRRRDITPMDVAFVRPQTPFRHVVNFEQEFDTAFHILVFNFPIFYQSPLFSLP